MATWKCKQRTDTGYRSNIFFSFFYGRSARSAGASGPTVVRGALTQGAEGKKKKKKFGMAGAESRSLGYYPDSNSNSLLVTSGKEIRLVGTKSKQINKRIPDSNPG